MSSVISDSSLSDDSGARFLLLQAVREEREMENKQSSPIIMNGRSRCKVRLRSRPRWKNWREIINPCKVDPIRTPETINKAAAPSQTGN